MRSCQNGIMYKTQRRGTIFGEAMINPENHKKEFATVPGFCCWSELPRFSSSLRESSSVLILKVIANLEKGTLIEFSMLILIKFFEILITNVTLKIKTRRMEVICPNFLRNEWWI